MKFQSSNFKEEKMVWGKVLFITKSSYRYEGDREVSRGLSVSAAKVIEALRARGVDCVLAEAVDGNSIDRLVATIRPERVVLEAIWVEPRKMQELKMLWPKVRWTVRVHSEIPFLANEGQAVAWLKAYHRIGVEVAFNSLTAAVDFGVVLPGRLLPNLYIARGGCGADHTSGNLLDVGCFGAIRPLKNLLLQACAALTFARETRCGLRFHMNGSRLEQQGQSNLRNIEALFDGAPDAELVLHPWLSHGEFLALVARMDIVLQVSLTESFCIVAADAADVGVPVVGSPAIGWLPAECQADPLQVQSIVHAMARANAETASAAEKALRKHTAESTEIWLHWLARDF